MQILFFDLNFGKYLTRVVSDSSITCSHKEIYIKKGSFQVITNMADHVEETDSDSEYETKEVTVLVDLKGVIDSDFLSQTPFERFKIIGLETPNPILQLNNYHFSGEFDETLGTSLFFKEDDEEYEESDPIFGHSPNQRLKYAYRTIKLLNMRRVFITEKKGEASKEVAENASVSQEKES